MCKRGVRKGVRGEAMQSLLRKLVSNSAVSRELNCSAITEKGINYNLSFSVELFPILQKKKKNSFLISLLKTTHKFT